MGRAVGEVQAGVAYCERDHGHGQDPLAADPVGHAATHDQPDQPGSVRGDPEHGDGDGTESTLPAQEVVLQLPARRSFERNEEEEQPHGRESAPVSRQSTQCRVQLCPPLTDVAFEPLALDHSAGDTGNGGEGEERNEVEQSPG